MNIFEQRSGDFFISTDISKIDRQKVHHWIRNSYWGGTVTREDFDKLLEHAVCFSIFVSDGEKQVGFGRVISDFASFAYLSDIIVDGDFRGQGVGKAILASMVAHPRLQNLRRWLLKTNDAHKLYEKFGFQNLNEPDRFMEMIPGKKGETFENPI